MMSNYDHTQAKLLMLCSDLCYEQFTKGQSDSSYNGDISQLPSYNKLPSGYTQVATLSAPEFSFLSDSDFSHYIKNTSNVDLSDKQALRNISADLKDVFFGFVLKSNTQNIVAIRGTQTNQEWLIDFTAIQVPIPLNWLNTQHQYTGAKMHLGFLIQYTFLFEQVNDGVNQVDGTLPIYITGHSLGAALAVVAATVIRIWNYPIAGLLNDVRMYNFAGPRVGNQAFVNDYNILVQDSYRIVNLADIVPVLPPTQLSIGGISIQYSHVGNEVSYLWQKGNVSDNHSAVNNYTPAVEQDIPTDTPPMPNKPVSGR